LEERTATLTERTKTPETFRCSLSAGDWVKLFGLLEQVLVVNKELLRQLEESGKPIGHIFLTMAHFLKIYSFYADGLGAAQSTLTAALNDARFASWLKGRYALARPTLLAKGIAATHSACYADCSFAAADSMIFVSPLIAMRGHAERPRLATQ
jgi:hypothetical protein